MYLVQSTADIDRRRLNDVVHNLGKRRQEVGRVDFRVEENLWREEALVSYIDIVFLGL